jgi:hypothetical protein
MRDPGMLAPLVWFGRHNFGWCLPLPFHCLPLVSSCVWACLGVGDTWFWPSAFFPTCLLLGFLLCLTPLNPWQEDFHSEGRLVWRCVPPSCLQREDCHLFVPCTSLPLVSLPPAALWRRIFRKPFCYIGCMYFWDSITGLYLCAKWLLSQSCFHLNHQIYFFSISSLRFMLAWSSYIFM